MEAIATQGWSTPYTATDRRVAHLLPSLTDFAFLLPLFLLFSLLPGAQMLLGDGDTGWHIRTGEWILAHKAVPFVDLFSFTRAGQPWFAWEWGWDALFAWIHGFAGLSGVVFVSMLLLGIMSALEFRLIRRCCGNDLMAVPFTVLAVCASMVHWLARPHLFSWVFALVFLHAIVSAENGKMRALYWLPFVTLFWVNIHGGFLVGIVLLSTSGVAEVMRALFGSQAPLRDAYTRSRPYWFAALGCLAVSFLNPYTWGLHRHVIAYLRNSALLDNIQEFQSVNFHRSGSIFFECMLLLGVGAALWCLRRGKIAAGLSVLLWAHLALVSERNVPIFALIAAPWAASLTLDVAAQLRDVRWLRTAHKSLAEICAEFQPLERIERYHLVSLFAVLFMAGCFVARGPKFDPQFSRKEFALQAIPDLKSLKGVRVFTSDQWSDYLIYRFYPGEQVFFDGRSDFYGIDMIRTYQHIMGARYDCESDLERYGIAAVVVKPDAPLATVLKRSSQWKLVFDDKAVVVFRAHSGTHDGAAPTVSTAVSVKPPGISTISALNDTTSTFHERRSL